MLKRSSLISHGANFGLGTHQGKAKADPDDNQQKGGGYEPRIPFRSGDQHGKAREA
jgi:hypothetical protein